ncbi:MAG TPA: class I SAM-dependent methyltransferase [Pirellulales bacterium]|nr:class I SAM-dependent methyltransferase [Pirellulales bacterium]
MPSRSADFGDFGPSDVTAASIDPVIGPGRSRRPDGRPLRYRDLSLVFDRYARGTPVAYSWFRAAECHALAAVDCRRPLLDLGCGTGEFAAFALERGADGRVVDAGIDLSECRLRRARERAAHALLARADAAALPFANGSFSSVLAVSVCEHLGDPAAVLAEVRRVLRPGGKFIATIVLADIHRYLFYPRACERLGMPWLARLYRRLHDHVFGHKTLRPEEEWRALLRVSGFRIIVARKIVSPTLTLWFDFWLITAWPYKLIQWTGARPFEWRPFWLRRLCWNRFRAIDAERGTAGSAVLVVAEKSQE